MKRSLLLLAVAASIFSCEKSNDAPPLPPEPKDTLLNWRKFPSPITAHISDIWFANASTGMISSSEGIHKTNDGGNTWSRTLATGKYLNFFFLTPQLGFVQGFGDFAFTRNGGDSWTHKALHPAGFPNSLYADLRDIFFVSASTGYFLSGPGLYKTTDTGNTWNLFYNKPAYAISFLDINRGYLYSEDKIYKTDNGGNTWQPIGTIVVPQKPQDNWYLLHFIDDKNGMFSGNTIFATTSDGGVTWTQKVFTEKVQDIHFLSKDVGYLMSRKEIFKTTDGGNSWTRSCRVAKDALFELYFTDPNTGWAVGENGLLLGLK